MKKYILFSAYMYGTRIPSPQYVLKRLSNTRPNQMSASTARMFGNRFADEYTGQWISEGAYLQMKAVPKNQLMTRDVEMALCAFPWKGHDVV